jgi:hypothetical protein
MLLSDKSGSGERPANRLRRKNVGIIGLLVVIILIILLLRLL